MLLWKDRATALKNLSRAFTLNHLELLDILASDPGPQSSPQWITKVQQMHAIFKNLHFLVNGYRPHQARATLLEMLEVQIGERKEAAQKLREAREQVIRELEAVGVVLGKWTEQQGIAGTGGVAVAHDEPKDTEMNDA